MSKDIGILYKHYTQDRIAGMYIKNYNNLLLLKYIYRVWNGYEMVPVLKELTLSEL